MYQDRSIDGSLMRNLYALLKYTPLGSYYNDAI